MLCDSCRNEARPAGNAGLAGLPGGDRLGDILCEGCGELLPARDATDRFLRRLTQLASFGLAGGGGPILKS
jgi:hypothetical protein